MICVAAVGLGGLTGTYVLPDASPARTAPVPSTSVVTPTTRPTATPSPSLTPSPSPSPAKRLTESDLLSVRSFADQSVAVTSYPQGGKTDPSMDATLCVADDPHAGKRTLHDLTGHDPTLQGYWTETDDGYAAGQLASTADDPADAEDSVTALVAAQRPCLAAKPGHWVLGPARTADFSSTRSATWFGYFPDEQNTEGRAPDDVEPCGGTLVARNGARFTVVNVRMCLDEGQLAGLSEAASERLG
ncbi:hypothetical protein GCM10009593_30770 [Microlunatus antarcticus]